MPSHPRSTRLLEQGVKTPCQDDVRGGVPWRKLRMSFVPVDLKEAWHERFLELLPRRCLQPVHHHRQRPLSLHRDQSRKLAALPVPPQPRTKNAPRQHLERWAQRNRPSRQGGACDEIGPFANISGMVWMCVVFFMDHHHVLPARQTTIIMDRRIGTQTPSSSSSPSLHSFDCEQNERPETSPYCPLPR